MALVIGLLVTLEPKPPKYQLIGICFAILTSQLHADLRNNIFLGLQHSIFHHSELPPSANLLHDP